jgi:hypothetical protein
MSSSEESLDIRAPHAPAEQPAASQPAPAAAPRSPSPAEELSHAAAELAALGYAYNERDELRSLSDGSSFAFEGQKHYEKLADAVAGYVQALLLARAGLRRVLVDSVPVFVSPDLGSRDGCLVLLCGAGQVAAGQWARRLCINEALDTGSVLPYVRWAQAQGLSVVIPNPNHARVRSSERHTVAVWRALLEPRLPALRHVAMVAHSYGGVCTVALLRSALPSVLQLLRGVALTDSVHGRGIDEAPLAERSFFSHSCVNWVTSREPRDTLIRPAKHPAERAQQSLHPLALLRGVGKKAKTEAPRGGGGCDAARVSAGHTAHESTSEACRPSACAFLLSKLQAAGWCSPNAQAAAAAAAAEAAAAAVEAAAEPEPPAGDAEPPSGDMEEDSPAAPQAAVPLALLAPPPMEPIAPPPLAGKDAAAQKEAADGMEAEDYGAPPATAPEGDAAAGVCESPAVPRAEAAADAPADATVDAPVFDAPLLAAEAAPVEPAPIEAAAVEPVAEEEPADGVGGEGGEGKGVELAGGLGGKGSAEEEKEPQQV